MKYMLVCINNLQTALFTFWLKLCHKKNLFKSSLSLSLLLLLPDINLKKITNFIKKDFTNCSWSVLVRTGFIQPVIISRFFLFLTSRITSWLDLWGHVLGILEESGSWFDSEKNCKKKLSSFVLPFFTGFVNQEKLPV